VKFLREQLEHAKQTNIAAKISHKAILFVMLFTFKTSSQTKFMKTGRSNLLKIMAKMCACMLRCSAKSVRACHRLEQWFPTWGT